MKNGRKKKSWLFLRQNQEGKQLSSKAKSVSEDENTSVYPD